MSNNPPKAAPLPADSDGLDAVLTKLPQYNLGKDPITNEPFTPEETYAIYPELKQAKAALQAIIAEKERMANIEKLEILCSLADMYGQYCDGPYGHDFMSAGEGAIEILENYGLASENKGVDYKALDKMTEKLEQLKDAADGRGE